MGDEFDVSDVVICSTADRFRNNHDQSSSHAFQENIWHRKWSVGAPLHRCECSHEENRQFSGLGTRFWMVESTSQMSWCSPIGYLLRNTFAIWVLYPIKHSSPFLVCAFMRAIAFFWCNAHIYCKFKWRPYLVSLVEDLGEDLKHADMWKDKFTHS